MGLSGAGGGLDVGWGEVGVAEGDVVPDGAVEQVDVLGHEGDGVEKLLGGQVAQVDAADGDGTAVRVPESGNEVEQGGFAGPLGPTIAVTVCAGTVKVTSCSTGWSG